jgi:1-acyl-sn-glycerol-3-phosphate acyltransferase
LDNTNNSPIRPRSLSPTQRACGYTRARIRLVFALAWIFACYVTLKLISLSKLFSPKTHKELSNDLAHVWISGCRRIIGMRIRITNERPADIRLIVMNHIAWLDYYGLYGVVDVIPVVEAPMGELPIIGELVAASNPIFVRRVKEDTPRVKALIIQTIAQGKSVLIAPETPETTIHRGSGVRLFRGGLIDAAVVAKIPVHYMSITYRTPPGFPPPSKTMVFGPNKYLPTHDGNIPQSEYAMYEKQTFLQHLMKLLALPYFEFIVTFGAEPICGAERIELANNLHDAVERIFTPIE